MLHLLFTFIYVINYISLLFIKKIVIIFRLKINQAVGYGEALAQTPQVFPVASLIYPFYPQFPHEFLIFQ
jgi:hypothetical protein